MSLLESTNMSKLNQGRIDIIMGCMFSGKSTELIRLANIYKVLDKKILIVNHSLDKRYSDNAIATHNNMTMSCISCDELNFKQSPEYTLCDILIIEEAQFFKGLYEFVLESCEKDGKIVIVVGLDGDSSRKEFGDIIKLIPVADTVRKLHGLCVKCKDGTKASFTKRLIDNDDQIFIGSSEFIAVCRKHYLEE